MSSDKVQLVLKNNGNINNNKSIVHNQHYLCVFKIIRLLLKSGHF